VPALGDALGLGDPRGRLAEPFRFGDFTMSTSTGWIAILTVVAAASVSGCGSACADLSEQCGDCAGTDAVSVNVEQTCNAVVNADDAESCEAALSNAFYKCPE
jgi:hypothetical protein